MLHRQHLLHSSWKCFEEASQITEYSHNQDPWPWAQEIFSAECNLIPREVKLFLSVAKKTSKLSNHFVLRDAENVLRRPTGWRPQLTAEFLGSIELFVLCRVLMFPSCMPNIKRTLTWKREDWRAASVSGIRARQRKGLFQEENSESYQSRRCSVFIPLLILAFQHPKGLLFSGANKRW